MTFNEYIAKRRQSLSFIETNKNLVFGDLTIAKGTDLPVDDISIAQVAKEDADFDFKAILVNMAMVLGLDGEFPHRELYRSMLSSLIEHPADYCLAMAMQHVVSKDYAAAIGLLNSAIKFDEGNAVAYYELGRLYYAMSVDEVSVDELLPRARRALNCALQLESDPQTHYYLAFVCFHLKDFEQAYRHASEAMHCGLSGDLKDDLIVKMAHFEDRAQFAQGYQHIKAKRYQEAVEAFGSISEMGEDDYRVQFFMGVAYRALGQASTALMHLNKARDLNPAEAIIYDELTASYTAVGDLTSAMRMMAEAIRLVPNEADYHYQMARLLYSGAKYDLAREFLDVAKSIDEQARFDALADAIEGALRGEC